MYYVWKNKFDEFGLYFGFVYDVLVVMVLVLNCLVEVFVVKNKSLVDFIYSDLEMVGVFKKFLFNVLFCGFLVREFILCYFKILLVF